MAKPITVDLPHQLGRDEARRRIDAGFAKIVHALPGGGGNLTQRWDGDWLVFRAVAMGQTISGVVDVLETVVKMEIELPGVLGLLAGSLTNRLQKTGSLLLTRK